MDGLRVGIIGLGSTWRRRYRPALLADPRRFIIEVVCDQVHYRAECEARRLGCPAAEGPTDLMQTDGLDAVLLVDPQWYGLWPLQQAARLNLPVLCVPSLASDPGHAEETCQRLHDSGLAVMFAHRDQYQPASRRLRRLIGDRIGQVQQVLAQVVMPRTEGESALGPEPDPTSGRLLDLIGWLSFILGQLATAVTSHPVPTDERPAPTLVTLGFASGCMAHLTLLRWSAAGGQASEEFRFLGEKGAVAVTFPGTLTWHGRTMICRETLLSPVTPEQRILLQFHHVLRGPGGGVPEAANWRTAFHHWRLLEPVRTHNLGITSQAKPVASETPEVPAGEAS